MQDAQMTVLAGSGAPVTLDQQAVEDVARLALRTASSPKRYATGVPASRRRAVRLVRAALLVHFVEPSQVTQTN